MTQAIDCKHWQPIPRGGICDAGIFGERPSLGACVLICKRCAGPHDMTHPALAGKLSPPHPNPAGFGDTLANAIHKVSRGKIRPCGGCEKRRKSLNKMFPAAPTGE